MPLLWRVADKVTLKLYFLLLNLSQIQNTHTHIHTQLIGLALIGGGSYLVHTGSNLDFFTGSRYFSGAVIIIVAGIITFLITLVGIVGAIMLNKFLLGLVSALCAYTSLN